MDYQNNLTQPTNISNAIPNINSNAIPNINSNISPTNKSNISFFSTLYEINATTWIIIILILAFLGFNIFVYLAKGTQDITSLLTKLFGASAAVAGQTINISAEGAKSVVGETAGAIDTTLSSVQNTLAPSNIKGQPINQQQVDLLQQSTLNKAINTAKNKELYQQDYQADMANSSIQGGGKAGWCYIGDDRGFRSCAQVGVNDTCMSGDIFPSQEICMNPSLRA
jgi:hypothetical protein